MCCCAGPFERALSLSWLLENIKFIVYKLLNF